MKAVIIANWKMYPRSYRDARKLFDATKRAAEKGKLQVIVAPPSLYLRDLRASYKGTRLSFATQHGHADALGAHTGEVSLAQCRDAGASYAIVGHSERRAAGESDADVRSQVASALALRITPIVCVGEKTRSQGGEHFNFVQEQLRAGLADVPPDKIARILIAYEPVWAIGGESAMSTRDMHEMSIFIRKTIVGLKGAAGMRTKILYGGSMTEENAGAMVREGDVDGLLVGHVCVDPVRFAALIASIASL